MAVPERQSILGVLLAGGQSRRMGGGDKSLAAIAGRTMLDHIQDRFVPQVGAAIINANGDPARFSAHGLPVAPDTIGGFNGPLAGVLTGMEWAREHAGDVGWIATAACDAPLLPADLVARQAAAVGDVPRRIALCSSFGRLHPVFGLWPVELAEDLRARPGGRDTKGAGLDRPT